MLEMEFSIAHNPARMEILFITHNLQEQKFRELTTYCSRRNVNFVEHDLLDVTLYPNDESLCRRRWKARDVTGWDS